MDLVSDQPQGGSNFGQERSLMPSHADARPLRWSDIVMAKNSVAVFYKVIAKFGTPRRGGDHGSGVAYKINNRAAATRPSIAGSFSVRMSFRV